MGVGEAHARATQGHTQFFLPIPLLLPGNKHLGDKVLHHVFPKLRNVIVIADHRYDRVIDISSHNPVAKITFVTNNRHQMMFMLLFCIEEEIVLKLCDKHHECSEQIFLRCENFDSNFVKNFQESPQTLWKFTNIHHNNLSGPNARHFDNTKDIPEVT